MDTVAAVEKRSLSLPLTRWDVAGAFGDIGILFPIAIALVSLNHMNPTAVFFTAGFAYILAGAYFNIPMAVQPSKAVAAIAPCSFRRPRLRRPDCSWESCYSSLD